MVSPPADAMTDTAQGELIVATLQAPLPKPAAPVKASVVTDPPCVMVLSYESKRVKSAPSELHLKIMMKNLEENGI